jgi:hypothetical protein
MSSFSPSMTRPVTPESQSAGEPAVAFQTFDVAAEKR